MQVGPRSSARSRSRSRLQRPVHRRPPPEASRSRSRLQPQPRRSRRRQASASPVWPASPEPSPGRRRRSDQPESRPRINPKLIADLCSRHAPATAPVEDKLPNGEKAPLQRRRRRRREAREEIEKEEEEPLTDDESAEADDGIDAVERLWVMQKDCARIVGRQGRNLSKIETESRVQMKVQREEGLDPAVKERWIDLTGTSRKRDEALTLILEIAHYCRTEEGTVLKDERGVNEDGEKCVDSMVLEVLVDEVGKVLGRKGDTVKKLEKESGARIDVEKTTGKLELIGSREAQERCLELLLEEVSFCKAQDGTIVKDVRRGPGESSAYQPMSGKLHDDTPPIKLLVSDRDAGKIIGRGGETVREMSEKTGADIKVQRNENGKSGSPREILIYGGESQREEAQETILGLVSWCKNSDGNFIKELPPPVEKKPVRHEDKRRPKRGEEVKRDRDIERQRPRNGGGKSRVSTGWVCSQCGGDHRSKECPHASGAGMMQMSMQMGMQMAMQGMMGMQAMMGGQPHAMMGMPGSMAGVPGIPGLPGMAGMPPHMMMRESGRRRRRDASPNVASQSGSGSGSEANVLAEVVPSRSNSCSPTAPGRQRRRDGGAYANGSSIGSQAEAAPGQRRRRDGGACTNDSGIGSQGEGSFDGHLQPRPRGPVDEGDPEDNQKFDALRGRVANLERKRPTGTR